MVVGRAYVGGLLLTLDRASQQLTFDVMQSSQPATEYPVEGVPDVS